MYITWQPCESFVKLFRQVRLENDRPTALRYAIQACRKSGTVVITGDYSGYIDKFPIGSVFNKGLTLKSGQSNAHKYKQPLLGRYESEHQAHHIKTSQ